MILMKMLMKNGSNEEMDETRYLKKKKKKLVKSPRNIFKRNAPNSSQQYCNELRKTKASSSCKIYLSISYV